MTVNENCALCGTDQDSHYDDVRCPAGRGLYSTTQVFTPRQPEQTLFEMDLPRAQSEESKRNAPKPATWFPKTKFELQTRGYVYGNDGRCRECQAHIEWWTTPTGKRIPIDRMDAALESPAVAHWATCTNASRFRKAGTR